MANYEVTCIHKQDHNDPDKRITHLGGAGWKLTSSEVIWYIENNVHTYHTYVNGRRANIEVVDGPNGKYLRTDADARWTNNLLALPECR
ncbi:DUF3892 domain-containing protein [Chitinophaga japonensis]|uniref:Uncharacterized protein DUF3892 n=1 Tax=Chitinophaga japonensis TaxID=104662 RepID=A0A562T5Q5_CHIJA|nr:DUF3892 domain-containing protein [Chitinophaga japonensis]TWI88584.1 uncharacterized protein DUF3892 [Chitinophaga japonensis]